MASLYKNLVRAGIPTDHHESDLYVLDTPAARETIKKYGYKFTTFTSDLDGKRWIDVPFAYEPFWEKKEQARRGAPSGKRSHATKRATSRSAWPSVVGSHDLGTLGTADVRTEQGAYWIVTRPTGYRVDYKPWGPSGEVDLGMFPSRKRAREAIAEHALSVGATVRHHATKARAKKKVGKRSRSSHAKMGRHGYDNGQRVVVLDYLGDPIGTGRVRSGGNYEESDENFTWVTMTRAGETVTEQWPTRRVILAR